MNGVIGMVHLLLDTQLDAKQERYVGAVRESGEALLAILNDILDFSKMEAGRLELAAEPFDPAYLVEGVVTLLGPKAQEKQLRLELHLPAELPEALRGDAGRLRQVLLNLLGNAIKFTEAGFVRIEVESADVPDGRAQLRIAVVDSGIGIPSEAQTQLFQEFSQVDHSTTRRFGGTGLGLAISRRIIDAMGGEIGAESTLGQGSRFWFTVALPTATREESRTAAPIPTLPSRPLRILVAEDNALNQEVAVGLLSRQGHTVEIAGTGRAAVDAVRSRDYDVVLMDVHMPELDGLAATREIRRLEGARGRIPIIALSASVLPGETAQCLAAGMNAHLPKPIDPTALATVLAQHTGPAPASTALEPSTSAAQLLDEQHLRQLLDALGRERVGDLITGLPEEIGAQRERLAAARADGDLAGMRSAAHAQKGVALNLGLIAFAELNREIEEACAGGRAADAEQLCADVEARWEESYALLSQLEL
jgi:CheY-like chemotaxis protein/HPt (histidine-containing phosphotransfer) domain-containing protein